MAKITVQLEIEIADKPFVNDIAIHLWLQRHLTDDAPKSLVNVLDIRLIGPRK